MEPEIRSSRVRLMLLVHRTMYFTLENLTPLAL